MGVVISDTTVPASHDILSLSLNHWTSTKVKRLIKMMLILGLVTVCGNDSNVSQTARISAVTIGLLEAT